MNEDKKPCEYWPVAPKTGYYNIGGKRVWLEAEDPFPEIAPRTWVGLTDEEVEEIERWVEFKEEGSGRIPMGKLVSYISEKLRNKNT